MKKRQKGFYGSSKVIEGVAARYGGVGQVVEKQLASGFDERAIDYAVAMRPRLASYYWPGFASRPGGVA
jgi:hypothetical protein